MKCTVTITRVEKKELDCPDRFGFDDSRVGNVVDILVGEERRNDLYSDNENTVLRAIGDIREAYEKAEKIEHYYKHGEPAPVR